MITRPCQHHGDKACMFHPSTMMGRVYIALLMSGFAFACILGLDKINDAGGSNAKRIVATCITSLGILVGFSWENCFDGGVGAVASLTPQPALAKLAFAVVVAMVVVPAWRKYILFKAMMHEALAAERAKSQDKHKHATQKDLMLIAAET